MRIPVCLFYDIVRDLFYGRICFCLFQSGYYSWAVLDLVGLILVRKCYPVCLCYTLIKKKYFEYEWGWIRLVQIKGVSA